MHRHLKPNAVEANLPNPAYAPQPNETFNADANIGHGFAIFMANVGALRPYGLRRRLTRALDRVNSGSAIGQSALNHHQFCKPCGVRL